MTLDKKTFDLLDNHLRYVISGDPVAFAKSKDVLHREWSKAKESMNMWKLELERQHEDRPMYNGPLMLEIDFYFPAVGNNKNSPHYHYSKPLLSDLVKFVERLGEDILYKNSYCICSVRSEKKWAWNPRTEFIVKEL